MLPLRPMQLDTGEGAASWGWPVVHDAGLNVGYLDGHVEMLVDPTRKKVFWAGQTRYYGTGDGLYVGGFDLR